MSRSHLPLPGRRTVLGLLAGAGAVATAPGLAYAQDEFGRAGLKGAGSTFVYPLAARWVHDYRRHLAGDGPLPTPNGGLDDDVAGVALDYEPVGSLAGIQRLRAGAVDFALSEMPLSSAELRTQRLRQIPLVLGAIAIAANLPVRDGASLHLTSEVVADIYLGKVSRWNDPAIRSLNPQQALPDAAIVALHRSDGSGSTYTLTYYLASHAPTWRQQVGADALVRWPGGKAARGSSGMTEALRNTPHAIGYLDAVQARRAGVAVASLRNAAGQFVAPEAGTAAAAAQSARWDAANDFASLLLDAPGERSYPLVASVFALLPDAPRQARVRRTAAFFDWALADGRRSAEQLGYLPLPTNALATVRAALTGTR